MGLFNKLIGRGNGDAMIVQPGIIVFRRRELAELMRRPTEPNFSTEPGSSNEPQAPCEKCGKPVAEVFITTGTMMGNPAVWLEHPVAVDGWACADCGVFRYPRRIDAARIIELGDAGVAHGRAGQFAEAELCFARIVWNWPGYVTGHINYAEAIRDRLHHAPPDDEQVRRRVTRRMIEQYEEAVEAFQRDPTPVEIAGSIARACALLAELAIQDRAFDRAKRYLDTFTALEGVPEQIAKAGRELADYVRTRRDLFDDASKVLSTRIRLSDRAARPPATPEERTLVVEATEKLTEHMRLAPDRWQPAWLHAKALHLLGKHAEAFDAWQRAFERFGDQRDLARDYGLELLEADRVTESRAVNRAIVERLPDDATLWCNLAVSELLCGDLDAAERAIRRSQVLDPSDKIADRLKIRLDFYRRGKPLPRTLRDLEQRF